MSKEIKSFSDWWEANKEKYEKNGVNEIVAKSIWDAACDTMSEQLLIQFEKATKNK